jgi:hypothetical protein
MYNIPIVELTLKELVKEDILHELLSKLNNTVGSSNLTCVEGG